MNFRRRLSNKHIRNQCQVQILDATRKPKRCTNLPARFADPGGQRTWFCEMHFRLFKADVLIAIENKNLEVVFADCRGRT
jgi:hypothetical protein